MMISTSFGLPKTRNWRCIASQDRQSLIKHLLCRLSRQLHSYLYAEKIQSAHLDGFNMPQLSWRAHIDLFVVSGDDGRLDVLQRQVTLPICLSDR